MTKYHIAIADTQFLVTESLKSLIESVDSLELAGVSGNLNQLTALIESKKIDLLITDYALFNFGNFESLRQLNDQFPNLKILILTNAVNRFEVGEFARAGIKNILLKIATKDEILHGIEQALNDKAHYSAAIVSLLVEASQAPTTKSELVPLTHSEIDIIKLIAKGLTTKEIAAKKCISHHTVMSHRKNIFRKVNVNNVSELIMYAMRAGHIDHIEYYI